MSPGDVSGLATLTSGTRQVGSSKVRPLAKAGVDVKVASCLGAAGTEPLALFVRAVVGTLPEYQPSL